MGVSTRSEPRSSGSRDHGFHPLRVRRLVAETSEAVSIVLEVPAELQEAFGYVAGQFLTFRVTIDGKQHLRSYSMSSSPEVDDELAVTVKRVAGGIVSNWIADALKEGDTLESTRPAGVFCLCGGGRGEVLAYAGGSGITPVYSLLKTALRTTTRRVRLLYANRDRESTIFAAELEALTERYPGRLEVVQHFDAAGGFLVADTIRQHAGAAENAADREVFICGPGPFMDLVEATLHEQGIGPASIHIERFTPAGPEEPTGAEDPQVAPEATQVEIELDGKVATGAHRPGTTILQTARQLGMTPPFSCEAGDCATCMGRLLEGTAKMNANNALSGDEVAEGWILTCQAVPDPPLVRVQYGYGD